MKLFYSWQSDLPSDHGRSKIKSALVRAIKELDSGSGLELDEATRDEAGSVDIVSSIMNKIESANIFIADISPMYKFETDEISKISPNPNVLFELGCAIHRLGKERIIQVCNSDYLRNKELPFDIRNNRILFYKSSDADLYLKFIDAIGIIMKKNPELPERVDARLYRDLAIAEPFRDSEFYEELNYRSESLITNRGCKSDFYDFLDKWIFYLGEPQNLHFDERLRGAQNKFKEAIENYRYMLAIQMSPPIEAIEQSLDFTFGVELKNRNPEVYYAKINKVQEASLSMFTTYQEYRDFIHEILLL